MLLRIITDDFGVPDFEWLTNSDMGAIDAAFTQCYAVHDFGIATSQDNQRAAWTRYTEEIIRVIEQRVESDGKIRHSQAVDKAREVLSLTHGHKGGNAQQGPHFCLPITTESVLRYYEATFKQIPAALFEVSQNDIVPPA
jgi:hypothetical protein